MGRFKTNVRKFSICHKPQIPGVGTAGFPQWEHLAALAKSRGEMDLKGRFRNEKYRSL